VCLSKVLTVAFVPLSLPNHLRGPSGQRPRPAVARTFNDMGSSVGPYRVGPSPATLDANPVLGVFRFELAHSQTFQCVVRAVPPSALPRRSLASVAPFPCPSGDCSPSLHVPFASLPEVLCPFSGHAVHLPHAASHRNTLVPSRRLPRSALQVAPPRRISDTPRVLSPSSRPCIDTCQACFIPAPLLGFCLQRSVHILSRTPLGSPCPAFPWQRRSPLGSPCSRPCGLLLN